MRKATYSFSVLVFTYYTKCMRNASAKIFFLNAETDAWEDGLWKYYIVHFLALCDLIPLSIIARKRKQITGKAWRRVHLSGIILI